jgi:hypothetical protein
MSGDSSSGVRRHTSGSRVSARSKLEIEASSTEHAAYDANLASDLLCRPTLPVRPAIRYGPAQVGNWQPASAQSH